MVATDGLEPQCTMPAGLSSLRIPFRHVALVPSEGLQPPSARRRGLNSMCLAVSPTRQMAGYSGVEPLQGDRQSPVLTDIRMLHTRHAARSREFEPHAERATRFIS